jgi:aryl-alcohol dehydrogenase-like predicted oxidoreductase
VVIATKFGIDIDHDTGERRGGVNSRPEHVKRVADASLRHLSVDVIEFVLSASCRPGGTD